MGGGGYVAGPVALAALTLRIPVVLTEADSHLGLTNRLLAPFARRVCLAFPIDGREGGRYRVTGRPVPAPARDRDGARERLGIGAEETCVLVFGGSLGARTINEAALDGRSRGSAFRVLHVAGARDYAGAARARAAARATTCASTSTSRLRRRAGGRGPRRRARRRLDLRDRRARRAGDPRALPARGGRPPERRTRAGWPTRARRS